MTFRNERFIPAKLYGCVPGNDRNGYGSVRQTAPIAFRTDPTTTPTRRLFESTTHEAKNAPGTNTIMYTSDSALTANAEVSQNARHSVATGANVIHINELLKLNTQNNPNITQRRLYSTMRAGVRR
jgi:hypothetical protein